MEITDALTMKDLLPILTLIVGFSLKSVINFLVDYSNKDKNQAVVNSENTKQIANLEIKFDTEKREWNKEIGRLYDKIEDVRVESKAEYMKLEAKVEDKNNHLSEMLSNFDKKFDKKFSELTNQILDLFKAAK